jgi:carbamoyltransferase
MKVVENFTFKEAADLIKNGKILSFFQGRSESGPRAFGNRSILFNPTIRGMNDYVNKIKGREIYRPVAATVLQEHAKKWFDMQKLKESPFMSYAVDVLESKILIVPAITHVDKTCRVQTVSKKQNKLYYDIIFEFYKLTNVPILGNTSFNLAGDPLVETINDALLTLEKSEIKYLFLPKNRQLIIIENEHTCY